jgi:hypothetical protein
MGDLLQRGKDYPLIIFSKYAELLKRSLLLEEFLQEFNDDGLKLEILKANP